MNQTENFIKFLGTAGARFVMINQLRSSGGIWFSLKNKNFILDPGPGSLVRCHTSRPRLDPKKLDVILLSHGHIDHSNDVNVMIEAMTQGGGVKRGKVILPKESLHPQKGVIFNYVRNLPKDILIMKPLKEYREADITIKIPLQMKHPVETYGIILETASERIGIIPDTDYFEEIITAYYDCDILLIYVVFAQPREDVQHLSIPEAIKIIKKINPKLAILTHFGMSIIKANPYKLEQDYKKQIPCLRFAYDGMKITLPITKDE